MKTLTLAAICLLATSASPVLADDAKPLPPCKPAAATKPATATTAQTGTATDADKTAESTATGTQVNAPADGGLQTPDRRVVMNTGQITGNPAVKCKPVSPPPVTPPQ